jgi:hypothetical protein
MAFCKLDLAVAALVAAALLWIEHDHRIFIGTPASAEAAARASAVCPESDSAPFSADCIAFIDGGALPDSHARTTTGASPAAHVRAALQSSACPPSNENAPYSADCIAFLSGWYWQAN